MSAEVVHRLGAALGIVLAVGAVAHWLKHVRRERRARRRMAAQRYDTAAGDTWALNELSSAVRRGDGTIRADVREFVRGLYEAGGELPAA